MFRQKFAQHRTRISSVSEVKLSNCLLYYVENSQEKHVEGDTKHKKASTQTM